MTEPAVDVRRRTGVRVIALAVLLVAAACGDGSAVEPAASSAPRSDLIVCGGAEFPADALADEPNAEMQDNPSSQGLRDLIANPDGIGELPASGWRLFSEDGQRAVFGAEDGEGWLIVALEREAGEWDFRSSGGCERPFRAPPPGASTAIWWPDPSAGDQGSTTTLEVLATDRDCASGVPADGRLRDPEVTEDEERVVVTFWADPVVGDQTCPGHAPAARTIRLDAPLGDRLLLDGAYWPPAPPREL